MSKPADEPIEIQCPKCGKKLKAGHSLAGKRVKCPKCANPFKVPGTEAAAPTTKPAVDTDWLSLDTPAIADAQSRTQAAAEVQAQREAVRARQHKIDGGKQPSVIVKPTADERNTDARNTEPLAAELRASSANSGSETEFQLAPLEARAQRQTTQNTLKTPAASSQTNVAQPSSPPPSNPAPGAQKPSIFDDDLPELAELGTAPPPLPKIKPLLEIDLEDVQQTSPRRPSSTATVPAARQRSSSGQPPDATAWNQSLLTEDAAPQEYRVICKTCGTAQYIPLSAQGKKIKCPDCHSDFKAPTYVAKSKPKLSMVDADVVLVAPEETKLKEEQVSQRHRANAMLERAQKELTEDEEERLFEGDFDTAGFFRRTFGFLTDPVAVSFMLGYGVVFAIVFGLFQYGLINKDDGFGRGALLIGMIGAPLLGILFGMPMLSAALALLESVANRQARVNDWPGFNMFEHFGDLLAMVAAILIAAIPGALLGFVFNGDEVAAYRMRMASAVFSTYLLFPVILLSILDNGSLTQPISESVLKSLKSGAEAWGAYYIKTMLAYGGAMVVWFIVLSPESSPAIVAIGGFIIAPLVFFTSQQLGALADDISEQLSFEFVPGSGAEKTKQADDPDEVEAQ